MVEEKKYTEEVFCIHKGYLINQGLTFCVINQDMSDCEHCQYRKTEMHEVTLRSTSTDENDIFYT